MLRIKLSDVQQMMELERSINSVPLQEIEWIDDFGKVIQVSEEEIEEWKFIGMSNVSFAECKIDPTIISILEISKQEEWKSSNERTVSWNKEQSKYLLNKLNQEQK